jgi:MFS superfamily sulfate permease-like transporter
VINRHLDYYRSYIKTDISAGLVVFLVALPLCLGIALASGAPLFSGLIAGIIGGLVVSLCSGSQLSVSGPAAGLTVIIFDAIEQLGSYSGFLVCVTLAGIIQIILGYLRAGLIGAFFPSAVIKGMLSAIGLILIIKQLPHAVGYDKHFEGDESYMDETAGESFQDIFDAFSHISLGATLITLVALLILIVWDTRLLQGFKLFRVIPSQLVAVLWGVGFNAAALQWFPKLAVNASHLVALPITESFSEFINLFSLPDFSYLMNPDVYTIAIMLAVIGSLETLLSLEAVDRLDPLKRIAPTNRELKAQGLGNTLSGMIGGLPITAVIVRSSANINAGGRTKIASFIHGLFLLLSVLFLTQILNLMPLACLAAILLQTGYKLAKPAIFIAMFRQGWVQFLPFVITIGAVLVTDLLQGVVIGIAIGLVFVMRSNYHKSITLQQDNGYQTLLLNKDVSFLNKALLRSLLHRVEKNSTLVIDASKAQFIDHDIHETLVNFLITAADDNITVRMCGFSEEQLPDLNSVAVDAH